MALYSAVADAIGYHSARHDLQYAQNKFWGTKMSTLAPDVLRKLEEHFPRDEIEEMDMNQLVRIVTAQGTVADAGTIEDLVREVA